MDAAYLKLIYSDRVNDRTREALLERLHCLAPVNASATINFPVLLAIIERLIPQGGNQDRVEIARLLDLRKQTNVGDGWRFADMPPDGVAFEIGLALIEETARRLYGNSFIALPPAEQDTLLRQVQRGEIAWPELDGRRWFEELVVEATEIYVSHPATLARMGFSGIAFLPRWAEVGLLTTQVWEPLARE